MDKAQLLKMAIEKLGLGLGKVGQGVGKGAKFAAEKGMPYAAKGLKSAGEYAMQNPKTAGGAALGLGAYGLGSALSPSDDEETYEELLEKLQRKAREREYGY